MNEPGKDKREYILKSAAIFFGKYGYGKTTLDNIAGYMRLKKIHSIIISQAKKHYYY